MAARPLLAERIRYHHEAGLDPDYVGAKKKKTAADSRTVFAKPKEVKGAHHLQHSQLYQFNTQQLKLHSITAGLKSAMFMRMSTQRDRPASAGPIPNAKMIVYALASCAMVPDASALRVPPHHEHGEWESFLFDSDHVGHAAFEPGI